MRLLRSMLIASFAVCFCLIQRTTIVQGYVDQTAFAVCWQENDRLYSKVDSLTDSLTKKNQALTTARKLLAQKDATIQRVESELVKKDQVIIQTQSVLTKTERELAQARAELSKKEKEIASFKQCVAKKERELTQAEQNISSLENQLRQYEDHCALLGTKERPASSCLEISNQRAAARSGAYYVSSRGRVREVYCHMENLGSCGGKAWTTLMKVDGRNSTFHYDSSLWTNCQTYNSAGGKTGFDFQESKTNAFGGMPFSSLCLVFRTFGFSQLGYVNIRHNASSLYSLITTNAQSYTQTSAGRAQWLSSIHGARLQPGCNQEGFNSRHPDTGARVRIGMMANNQLDCKTPDSVIGVGIKETFGSCCSMHSPGISAGYWTPRNPNTCCEPNETFRSGKVFAYIMAE